MSQVSFDPVSFLARYSEFAAVPTGALQAYFNEATIYLSNSDNSPVQDLTRRAVLLNMLTAHVGCLAGALGDGQARPVGRIASAGKGSVSTSLEYAPPGSRAWFNQTQYGASFIQASVNLTGFRYMRPHGHPGLYGRGL